MQIFFYIPVAAVFSGASVLAHLLSVRGRRPWQNALIILYCFLFLNNLCIAFMISRDSAKEAEFALFLLRHFFFSLPVLFLIFAVQLTDSPRKWILPALVYTALLIALADLDYLFQLHWLLDRMEKHSWGYFPRGQNAGIVALAMLAIYCIGMSFWLMLGPGSQRSRGEQGLASGPTGAREMTTISWLFALWWAGIILSMLPFVGFSVFPPGPSLDAILSAIIGALLTRQHRSSRMSRLLRSVSGLFASLALGTLAGWLALALFAALNPLVLVLAVSLASLLGLAGWNHLSRNAFRFRPIFVLLQEDYELTYEQARICEMLLDGLDRNQMEKRLSVGSGTFRNHLTSIYSKTIDIEDPGAEQSRDKLQRLTVFLSRLQASAQSEFRAQD